MVTTQDAKRYLERARDARRAAELAMEASQRLATDWGLGGMATTEPRVQTSACGDALERLAIARDEAALRLTMAVRDAVEVTSRIAAQILMLDDLDAEAVLLARYVDGARLEDLSDALRRYGVHVGQRQACRLLARGVREFAELMDRRGWRATAAA